MIQSVWIGSDAELVARLINLHSDRDRVLDVTFGHGRFWRSFKKRTRRSPAHEQFEVVGLDTRMGQLSADWKRSPQVVGRISGDYTSLPFADKSFDVIICDPPFLARGGTGSLMKQRYSDMESYDALLLSLQRASSEFLRVMRPGGIVVLKIMDLTEGRRRRWTHIDVANLWSSRLRLDDLVVKVAPQSMDSPTWIRQQRTRSSHTFFMVFRPIRKKLEARAPSQNGSHNDG